MAFAAIHLDDYRESLKRKKKTTKTDSTLTGDGQDVKLEKQAVEVEVTLPAASFEADAVDRLPAQ